MENQQSENTDIRYIGKIDDYDYDPIIFVQNDRNVRIQLRILSNNADNTLYNERVYVFEDEISDLQFYNMYANEERKQKIKDYLEDKVLIFSIVKKIAPVESDREYFYNAKNVEIRKVNREISKDTKFKAITVIPVIKDTLLDTKNLLINNRYRKVSKEQINVMPSDLNYVCLIENSSDKEPENFLFIGQFSSHSINESHGLKLNFENSLKEFSISAKQWTNYYLSNKNVMFVPESEFLGMKNNLINKGEVISLDISKEEKIESEEELDEKEFIETFYNVCLAKGLVYSKLDLINFHTAMKTNSFVVLAGMSGTGKSALIQCYHEAINNGKNDFTEKTLKFISVKPSWQDDSDLLGYLDTVNNVYRPGDTGLVSFIKNASKDENKDECFIVCLDEMNLSKVEHYFSQFLSILERETNQRKLNLYNVQINNHVYNENDYPSDLLIPENIFFVGTINIDESTHKFSDKVLDRANIIELELQKFSDVKEKLLNYKNKEMQLPNGQRPKSFTKFKGMVTNDNKGNLTLKELEFLWDIHELINQKLFNTGVGMRIVIQIEKYLKNLPENSDLSRSSALDLQVVQRILTKISGSENLLKDLVRIEDEKLEGLLLEKLEEFNDISDFKRSKIKLYQIAMELSEYGYTL